MSDLLELKNVSRHFGGLKVLQDVSFSVKPGTISGLIGPNGAGKTTVFNLITGLLPPTTGDITLDGASLVGRKPHAITRSGIARTFQNIRIFKEMTLLENVMVGMHRHLHYGVAGLVFALPTYRAAERQARDRARELLSWVGLEGKAADIADKLSYGEQRKLELARALATDPKLLLLDEIAGGLSQPECEELVTLVRRVHASGVTIVWIEHVLHALMSVVSRALVLYQGKFIADGPPGEVIRDPKVAEIYMGIEADA